MLQCQFIYIANYVAEIKVLHEGSDPGSQPTASQLDLLMGILTQYSPRCHNWVSSSPGSSGVDGALWELESFSSAHRHHPGHRKGISIYILQAEYRVGADLYNGFSAAQLPKAISQLEARVGESAVCLCP